MNDHLNLALQAARELQIEVYEVSSIIKFRDRHGNPAEVTIGNDETFTAIHAKLKEAKRGK